MFTYVVVCVYRISELQDQIEVLENSLQLKTNSLTKRVLPADFSSQKWSELQTKILGFNLKEAQSLLVQSIVRITELEDELRVKEEQQKELEIELDKKYETVDVLKHSLTQLEFDKEQKLDRSHKVGLIPMLLGIGMRIVETCARCSNVT